MTNKTLTLDEYYMAKALFTFAREQYVGGQKFEALLAKHLEREEGYFNKLSDAFFDADISFEEAMEYDGYTVEEEKTVAEETTKVLTWTYDVEDERVHINDIKNNHWSFAEVVIQMGEAKFQDPEMVRRARLIINAPELYSSLKALTTACLDQGIKLGSLTGDAEEVLSEVEEKGAF